MRWVCDPGLTWAVGAASETLPTIYMIDGGVVREGKRERVPPLLHMKVILANLTYTRVSGAIL